MRKKGITLIEVMVSMGLFAVLATIIIGAFVMILNMKTLVNNMKESQQKTRMALEIISRLARQTNRPEISDTTGMGDPTNGIGNVVIFYFPQQPPAVPPDPPEPPATKFTIGTIVPGAKVTLYSQECIAWTSGTCNPTGWTSPNELLGGLISLEQTYFVLSGTPPANPPTLSIILNGSINGINTNPYYSNDFKIDNKVIMENLPWAQY